MSPQPPARAPELTVALLEEDPGPGLARSLLSLASQTVAVPWEALVVSRSGAGARQAGTRMAPLRAVQPARWSPWSVRQAAWGAARGRCLILISAGLECLPGCVERLRRCIMDSGQALAAGRVFPRLPPAAPRVLREALDQGLEVVERYDLGLAERPVTPADPAPRPRHLLAVRTDTPRSGRDGDWLEAIRRERGLYYCAGATAVRSFTLEELDAAALAQRWQRLGRLLAAEQLAAGGRRPALAWRALVKWLRSRERRRGARGGADLEALRRDLRYHVHKGRCLESLGL